MTGHEREAVALIAAMVESAGLSWTTRQGGKHLAVVVRGPRGVRGKFPVSGSPRSSSCQLRHIRQQVTSWLEREGFAAPRGAPGERRQRTARTRCTARPALRPDPETRLSADPFAALASLKEQTA